jgi:hypothetical protein
VAPTSTGIKGLITGVVAALLGLLAFAPSQVIAATPSSQPLPRSDYAVRPACAAPPPGHVGCLAERLVPLTAEARSHSHPLGVTLAQGEAAEGHVAYSAYGLSPEDLHDAYELPLTAPDPQTIAIVDAYDDPNIEADLGVYDEAFGLPACTTANGCFRKINQYGQTSPLPSANTEWAGEISLDVETVHAVCQNCKIILVEAESSWSDDLEESVDMAVAEGADEISNSYGSPGGSSGDAYDHPGAVITASTGDWGYDNWVSPEWGEEANFPASAPSVVSVGGTSLYVSGESWAEEVPWVEGGSGCSASASAPAWQASVPDWAQVGCGTRRATADVAADADPYTGVAVYDSGDHGWGTWGGTSLASPIIAAVFALAGGSHGVEYPALTLYRHLGTAGLHDIVSGSNWGCAKRAGCTEAEEVANCSGELICNAGPGYDGPTGVGTPDGLTAFGGGTPEPPPTITAVDPARGRAVGGETVTIEGTHLKEAESVRFGAENATIVVDEEESITVETPVHQPEVVDVTVVGSEGTRSATSDADHYEYFVATPSVTSIEPDEGPTAGGTRVTIHGANLEDAEAVYFGGSYAPVESAGAASIVTTSPEHEPGQIDVTVEGPWGRRSPTSPDDIFTYPPPPLPPEAGIDLTMGGSGHGVVFGMPSGQPCDSSCSATAPEGTQLYLSAAASTGSNFVGWSGAGCLGAGMCVVTLVGDVTVTADFEAAGGTVPSGSTGGGGLSGGNQSGSGSTGSDRPGGEADSAGPHGSGVEPHGYTRCTRMAEHSFRVARSAAKKVRGEARKRRLAGARRSERRRLAVCRSRFPGRAA